MEIVRFLTEPSLVLVSGIAIGFGWLYSAVSSKGHILGKWGAHTILGLVTTVGAIVLGRWKGQINPQNGFCWVVGMVSGILLGYRGILRSTVSSVLVQSGHDIRSDVLAFVKNKLLREGAEQTEQQAIAWLKQKSEKNSVDGLRATAQLHDYIHGLRESAVKEFERIGSAMREAIQQGRGFTPDLSGYLDQTVLLYRELLADITGERNGLWVALRRLQNIEGGTGYVTIIRKGDMDDSARSKNSEPVSADEGLPKALEDDLNNAKKPGRGVLLIGPNEKKRSARWKRTPNDARGEDKFLMAAPITIRRSGPKGLVSREMVMILYANHSRNVFRRWQCDIVRCCVDTVSTALSLAVPLTFSASAGTGRLPLPGSDAPKPQVAGETADVCAMKEVTNVSS